MGRGAGMMSIQYNAFGFNMHDHLRYERGVMRTFTQAQQNWNTVTVDRKSGFPSGPNACVPGVANGAKGKAGWMAQGGDAVLFEPGLLGVAVAEVDGYRGYYPTTQPGGFTRLLVHVTIDPNHPYTLDVFRVKVMLAPAGRAGSGRPCSRLLAPTGPGCPGSRACRRRSSLARASSSSPPDARWPGPIRRPPSSLI